MALKFCLAKRGESNEIAPEAVNGNRAHPFVSRSLALRAARVFAAVACEIVAPLPERPTEGFFKLDVDISPMSDPTVDAERASPAAMALSRLVEKSLRDSDAVDVESL